jgi:di/tricarboxylate transporter
MKDQILIMLILASMLGLFIYGRWRYDAVAMAALLAAVLCGLVEPGQAFLGFGHPAVVTVGAVLALSAALQKAGVVDLILRLFTKFNDSFIVQLAILNIVIAAISGFMNNIGALAILLPVTLHMAKQAGRSASNYLMPVAFSSLLGGMVTVIGTPPNIIVSMMREQALGSPFSMFDFAPVGLGVAIAGVAYLTLVGWRLLPERKGVPQGEEIFDVADYVMELKITKKRDQTVKEFEESVEGDLTVLGITRKSGHIQNPRATDYIEVNDVLLVEADSETLSQLEGCEITGDFDLQKELFGSDEVLVQEIVIGTHSSLVGKKMRGVSFRGRFGVNLLAVSRQGKRIGKRLSDESFRSGDVLLLRGTEQAIGELVTQLNCLPLQYRGLNVGEAKGLIPVLLIFATAIILSALQIVPIQIAFVSAVVLMHVLKVLPVREIYRSIDWGMIILLGALIPVGHAMETTGAANTVARSILYFGQGWHPAIVLTIVLVSTMFLSDLVNNAAAAVLMVPIALSVAMGMEVSADSYLMAVAIGASCPFLTPIGHQCNTIILGPGGYHFSDYWKVGLLLEVIIVAVSIPLLMFFWPF